ncbi:MAG TPA: hypothetical protein VGX91_12340 [Candidatus Cybelea sp.]|nr:hypothetical protein [Candidatus Cybelea sp.]
MNRSALSWALSGAVRFAVATAIVAMLFAVALPDTGPERFATTAYLAVIFAAIALGARQLVRDDAPQQPQVVRARPSFPTLLGFAIGLTILLVASASFAADPSDEVRLIVYGLVAIGVAAIGRGGAFVWLNARLVSGGRLSAFARYCVVGAVAALSISALVPQALAEPLAVVGYFAALAATMLVAWEVIAPSPFGDLIRASFARGAEGVAQLSADLVFARTIEYATLALIASMGLASLLRRPYSEPFATVGYLAAVFVAVGVAMECRRRMLHPLEAAEPNTSLMWEIDRRASAALEHFSRTLTLAGIIKYAASMTVVTFLVAAPLLRRYGEPFAAIGYTAAIVSMVAIAIECRQTRGTSQPTP